MTTEPYGIDPASLPPELLADIDKVLDGFTNNSRRIADSPVKRLRQLIAPPPPPECGWQPEGVVKAVQGLDGIVFKAPVSGPMIEVLKALAKVRCTLPAGHHKGRISRDKPCCDGDDHDQIHAGDEHRIEHWANP